MKRSVRLFVKLLAPVLGIMFVLSALTDRFTPDKLTMTAPGNDIILSSFPLSLDYGSGGTVPANTEQSGSGGSCESSARLNLFGFFPVKDVSINVSSRKNVIVGGRPLGIRIYSDGLVVSSTEDKISGEASPAEKSGIRQGDVLLSADGVPLRTNEQLMDIVSQGGGRSIRLRVRRDNEEFTASVTPVADETAHTYRLGLHVRDSIAGIGTLTFIDPSNNTFAGLGHGICDSESGCLMPMLEGDAVDAGITSVTPGVCGDPGTLVGSFTGSKPWGSLAMNSENGVYGRVISPDPDTSVLPVAFKQEILRGSARLITTINGTAPQSYDIEIEEISYNDRSTSKNMIVRITDEALLSQTGGIVQGMSGSPIIQNGRLVGAVTHVFVNDPTRGYAVFTENMLSYTDSISPAP